LISPAATRSIQAAVKAGSRPNYGAVVVDLFNKLTDPSLIGPDGLHPNSKGQQVIANAIAAKL
jgi:lysophospholipase L1-like esterase